MAQDIEFGSYTFINPKVSTYTNNNFNGTWITIEAREILNITADTGSSTGGLLLGEEIIDSWRFLAPESIQENVIHEWEPWETLSTRLAGMGLDIRQIGEQIWNLKDAFVQGGKEFSIQTIVNTLSKVTNQSNKVDTPLQYKDSQRMEWTMTFNLISDVSSDPGPNGESSSRGGLFDIMDPVRRLQELSSPTRNNKSGQIDGSTNIKRPHCFSLRSETYQNQYNGSDYAQEKGMINIGQTVLTSVQPTYMSPYDKYGYPMRCELTLTFKQFPPLYSDSFTLYET